MGLDGSADVARAGEDLAARLPEPLAPLARLAFNYRWSWMPGGTDLFRSIDPQRFDRVHHNPVRLLQEVPAATLRRVADDPAFVEWASSLEALLEEERRSVTGRPPGRIAFFCAEFGIHPSLPIYAGGLGVLAGDLLKEASDRGLPMMGVGLMYGEGYFHQRLDSAGWQHEYWIDSDPERVPAALVTREDGSPLTVGVPLGGRTVVLQVWRVDVGRLPLFLLDTRRADNGVIGRWVTARLYVGNRRLRLAQYAVLAIGGVRALRAMGIDPEVVHLNEGHAAFVPLELAAEDVEAGREFEDALDAARRRTVFTTHTPVPAGNESFDTEQVLTVVDELAARLKVPSERILGLGRINPEDAGEGFGITTLGLRCSRTANAVSRRHGEVARGMWHPLFPDRPVEEVPIRHVTNGVHVPTWIGGPMRDLLDRYLGEGWERRAADPATWEPVEGIPDEELWAVRNRLRAELVEYVRERSALDRLGRGASGEQVEAGLGEFDPGALTVGFARRAATYKRLYLLMHDPDRAVALLTGPRPIQLVLAGKAHPLDDEAKGMVRALFELDRAPRVASRVAYLEDYDMGMAARLVRGCDLWVNLPRPPLEASGTSGMKAALNGVLNLSTLDGWWAEAYDGTNGWAVDSPQGVGYEAQDAADASALYDLTEREVIPLFHDVDERGIPVGWVRRVKASLRTVGPRFNTVRVMDDYLAGTYPAEIGAPVVSPGS